MRTRISIAAGVLLALGLGVLYVAGPPAADDPPGRAATRGTSDLDRRDPADAEHASRQGIGEQVVAGESEGLRITGLVIGNSTMEPIEGVTVAAYDRVLPFEEAPWVRRIMEGAGWGLWVEHPPLGRPSAESRTDKEGTFTLEVPREGPYAVIAHKAPLGGDGVIAHSGACVHLRLATVMERRSRLVYPEGDPVEGVEALVFPRFDGEPPLTRTVSGSNGEILFRADGDDQVLLRRTGLLTRLLEAGEFRPGRPVVMERGCALDGEVRDPEGRPVEGAAVLLVHALPELRITGPDGRFSFDGASTSLCDGTIVVPRTDLGLVVDHPDFLPEETWDLPEQGDLIVTLSRRGTARISGRIVVKRGTRPNLEPWAAHRLGYPEVVIRDDSTFVVSGLPPGEVSLVLTCERDVPTFWGGTESYISHHGEVTVSLEAGQDLEGIVIESEKRDVSFVAPRAVDPEGRYLELVRFKTKELGCSVSGMWFALNVPPGSSVAFTIERQRTKEFASGESVSLVTSADSSVSPVEVVLCRNPLFTFELVDEEGRPVPSDGVDLSFAQGGSSWGARRGRGGGDVSTSHLDPGQGFRIKATARGYGAVAEYRGPPDPDNPRQKIVFAPESRIRGRLVIARDRPVLRAYLEVNRLFEGARPVCLARTEDLDTEGRFSIGGLPAGRARVTAFVKSEFGGLILAETTLLVPRGGTADAGTLVLGSLPEVHGFATDGDGHALAGVLVRYCDESGDWYETRTTTKSDGSFRLSVPRRPGSCLEFERTGFRLRKLDLTPEHFANPVTICLTPGSE